MFFCTKPNPRHAPLFSLAVVLLLGSSCARSGLIAGDGDEQPDCVVDADCDEGEGCMNGVCEPVQGLCDTDADCGSAAHCDQGLCVDNPTCEEDADCPPSMECTDGYCTDRPSCEDDGDCALTERCEEGVCVDRPSCEEDADCRDTDTCEDDTCQPIGECEGDDDCPAFAHCEEGACVTNDPCESDDDCPATQECTDGYCTDRPACQEHADCAADELCTDGTCQPIGECEDDADCPASASCEDGACTQNPACLDDLDCEVTERCEDGLCTAIGECEDDEDCGPGNACDSGTCVHAVCETAAECQDGAFCNGAETCDPVVGCLSGTPPTEDDGFACTTASCDEELDEIVHQPDDSQCDDGNPCTAGVCSPTEGCTFPADDTAVPPQSASDDCVAEICQGGDVVQVAADAEVPPQEASDDCVAEVCQGGDVVQVADNNEVPPQQATDDCVRNICLGGAPATTPADDEVPPQAGDDCVTLVCEGGVPTGLPADDEVPPDDGSECNEATCQDGQPTYVPDDAQCDDQVACTVGTCELDGTCGHTPDDSLCSCPSGDTGYCRPDDGAAQADGCVCLTPAELTCEVNPTQGQVLEPFTLTATAGGAAPGAAFLWEIVGVPAGEDASAHVLEDEDQLVASFTPTAPSADAADVYTLQGTLFEPDLAPQTCVVTLEALPLPDEFEVSLFMQDALDVDLHVAGGERADDPEYLRFDNPFHPQHDTSLGDDPSRNCYFGNCPVCSVSIPDQPECVAVDPRVVDFDQPADGAFLADLQDPQLDIDNRRGCFAGGGGAPVCVPEKVTVEEPDAGVYFVWPYLYGDPLSVTPGLLTTPTSTTVEIEVKCRGQVKRYTRTLSSEDSANPGAAAPAQSFDRLGGSAGFVRFEVPSDPNAPCVLP